MGSLSPLLKDELNSLLDPHQHQQRQSSFSDNPAKIQKVPPYLRQRSEFDKYYFPKVVSIGPIHHPKGEDYKKMWASTYLQDKIGQQDAQQLLEKIRFEIQELKKLYTEDVIQGLKNDDDDHLARILFVDGCASLHVMHKAVMESSKLQALDIIIQQDLLLLENQLPFKVLRILSKEDDSAVRSFINFILESRDVVSLSQVVINQPAHLLDLLITFMLRKEHTTIDVMPPQKVKSSTHRNIQELIMSGIKIKKKDKENLTSISFGGGTLYIPPLTVDDFTAQTFLNMIAYEMCPDNSKSNYVISNYVSFLNSLIVHEDDVKMLRKARVLNNLLGSDEEVVKIFNIISTDLVVDTRIHSQVRHDIENFYKKDQVRIWFIKLQRKHFNNPWKIIGLISGILGFVDLTVVSLLKGLCSKK